MNHEQKGTAQEAAVTNESESRRLLQKQGYCPYGHYPWDYWEKRALAAGLSEELAGLGRLVMREAHQHGWSARLQSLCGWQDRGGRMIKLALRSAATAQQRWQDLLETDGGRGAWDKETGEWVPFF
jgi:hypothetical protein